MHVTYSRNVFIPLTNACRNACTYCGFRSSKPWIMSRREVESLLLEGKKHGCKEALFTFGEKPESSPAVSRQLRQWGYSDVLEYLYDLCLLAIKHGLLPHSNPGVLTMDELKALRDVNASLGLMLENSSPRLCLEGMPHHHSPGKNPRLRLRTLKNAGKLRIPFTTGLLVGIGETVEEIQASLRDIAELHSRYGHIQEIIIQNFRPKKDTPMEAHPEPSVYEMIWTMKSAKELLPDIGLQVPPNLNPYTWSIYLLFGVDDLGGISPVTSDYINPPDAWPMIEDVESRLTPLGYRLKERLPIYPKYIARKWYSEELKPLIFKYADKDGFVIA